MNTFPPGFFQSCWEKHPFNKTDTPEHFASNLRGKTLWDGCWKCQEPEMMGQCGAMWEKVELLRSCLEFSWRNLLTTCLVWSLMWSFWYLSSIYCSLKFETFLNGLLILYKERSTKYWRGNLAIAASLTFFLFLFRHTWWGHHAMWGCPVSSQLNLSKFLDTCSWAEHFDPR